MRTAKLITTSGYTWTTDCNGTDQSICQYFLGNYFQVSQYPEEKREVCISCEIEGKKYELGEFNTDVRCVDKSAPAAIVTRGGKRAKLIELPIWNKWNEAYFVTYEHESHRFSLYWPSMSYHAPGGEAHSLDYEDTIEL